MFGLRAKRDKLKLDLDPDRLVVGALGGVVDRHGTYAVLQIGRHESIVDAIAATFLMAGPARPFPVAEREPGVDQAVVAQSSVFFGVGQRVKVAEQDRARGLTKE